jgi:DNA-binding response OmpR family regulator
MDHPAPHVRVVTEDTVFRDRLCDVLLQAGYQATAGTSALRAAGEPSPQIALVHLTDDTAQAAYDEIATLRRTPDLPIICISCTSSLPVRLAAFGHGADDVIVEPYSDEELLARLNVWVRRGLPSSSRWTVGDLVVDGSTGTVSRGGQFLHVTRTELALLVTLARADGAIVSREQLCAAVWPGREVTDNLLEIHIANLRKRIQSNGAPRLLHTLRSRGYRLAE